jgi:hypothetical protein
MSQSSYRCSTLHHIEHTLEQKRISRTKRLPMPSIAATASTMSSNFAPSALAPVGWRG